MVNLLDRLIPGCPANLWEVDRCAIVEFKLWNAVCPEYLDRESKNVTGSVTIVSCHGKVDGFAGYLLGEEADADARGAVVTRSNKPENFVAI